MRKTWKQLLEAPETSLNDRMRAVQKAVSTAYNQGPSDYCYVEVVFDGYVIVTKGSKLWKVVYTIADDGTVALSGDPVEVRQTYTPVNEGVIFGLMPDESVKEGETAPAPTGKRWGVLIIQEGMSKNRNRYQRKVLAEAAPLYEGRQVYIDHEEEDRKFGRSAKDLAGFIRNVQPCFVNVAAEGQRQEAVGRFALAAELVVTKQSIRQEMFDANEAGNPNLFGLSHDVMAESITVMAPAAEGGSFYDVQRIGSVQSVDLVTNPAAGGRVLRLVASATVPHTLEEDTRMLQKMIEAIKASGNSDLLARLEALGKTPTEDQVLGLYSEAMKGTGAASQHQEAAVVKKACPGCGKQEPASAAHCPDCGVKMTEAVKTPAAGAVATGAITEAEFMEVRRDGLLSFLETLVSGTALHEPVKAHLRTQLTGMVNDAKSRADLPTKQNMEAIVKQQVDLFAKLAEGKIVMPATGTARVQLGEGRREKSEAALDAFFGVKREGSGDNVTVKIVPGSQMTSFRRIYQDITGDMNVTGLVKEAKSLREALDSTSFDQALGDSITRRMVAEYQLAAQATWRGTIADVVPVTDFRTQRRIRFGGYGNLATVAQGAAYGSMTSPTDEEATYAPAKRGGTEQITIEMIANDDVGAIRRLPTRMARAASQTLYEFVLDFMRTNATIYDSVALAASGHGTNISTTALSSTQISALRLAIKNQTDMSSGKRIGLAAKLLWVPNELEELAFQITGADRAVPDSSLASTAMAAAPNFVRAQGIRPIVVDYWTDTNNYWLTADNSQTPMLEIGFWGGEEPQLFVQDMPNAGSLFANDAITYKIRHVYGGGVLDYRGFAGGIVA